MPPKRHRDRPGSGGERSYHPAADAQPQFPGPRLYGHSAQPDHGCGEVATREVVAVESIVSSRHAPEVFEFVEASFHEVPFSVSGTVAGDRPLAAPGRRNDHSHPFRADHVSEGSAVVTFVCDHPLGFHSFDQGWGT